MAGLQHRVVPDVHALQSLLHAKDQTIRSQSERIDELEGQLDWLKRQVFGRKSGRLVVPGQADLFAVEALEEGPAPAPDTEQITYARHKPKRNSLPKDLYPFTSKPNSGCSIWNRARTSHVYSFSTDAKGKIGD